MRWSDEYFQQAAQLYVQKYGEIAAVCFAPTELRDRIAKATKRGDVTKTERYTTLLARFEEDDCYPSAAIMNKEEGGFRGILQRAGLESFIVTDVRTKAGDKIKRMKAMQVAQKQFDNAPIVSAPSPAAVKEKNKKLAATLVAVEGD